MADVNCNFYFQDFVKEGHSYILPDEPFCQGMTFRGTLTGLTEEQVASLSNSMPKFTSMRVCVEPIGAASASVFKEETVVDAKLEDRLRFLEKRLERLERFERR